MQVAKDRSEEPADTCISDSRPLTKYLLTDSVLPRPTLELPDYGFLSNWKTKNTPERCVLSE